VLHPVDGLGHRRAVLALDVDSERALGQRAAHGGGGGGWGAVLEINLIFYAKK
jgi:hypothetical protein